MIEYELRKLDIDIDEIKQKLKSIGAEQSAEYSFRRYVYDVIPKQENRWIRLRTDDKKTTLTVKEVIENSVDGTHEWETVVGDFENTHQMLEKMGFKHRGYQENKRTEYKLDGVEICIDEWPKIPPYLELESTSEDKIYAVANKLSISSDELTGLNTQDIYLEYGVNLDELLELKF